MPDNNETALENAATAEEMEGGSADSSQKGTEHVTEPDTVSSDATVPQSAEPIKAGFGIRYFAHVTDNIIGGIICGFLDLMLYFIIGNAYLEPVFFFLPGAVCGFILLKRLYYIMTTFFFGASFGKLCLQLRVVDRDTCGKPTLWQVFFRETFGKFLSLMTLGIGYLMALRENRTALHDWLSDTKVVIKGN